MEKATDTAFPAALRGLGFSEMPLDVVASLADNLKVPLEKVPDTHSCSQKQGSC